MSDGTTKTVTALLTTITTAALVGLSPIIAGGQEQQPLALEPLAWAPSDNRQEPESHVPEDSLEITLMEAVENALRYNLQVKVNAYAQDLSAEEVNSARARFDPQLTFNLPQTFTRNTQASADQLSGAEVTTTERFSGGFSFRETLQWGTTYTVGWSAARNLSNSTFSSFNPSISSNLSLNLTQPLLNGFGREVNRQQIISAENSVGVSLEQFRQQVQNILFQAYRAYWELVFAFEDLEVKQLALELAAQQLERNLIQVEIGTLAPIETVQAEQAVANAEFVRTQAEITLADAQDDLRQFLNVEAWAADGWETAFFPTDEPQLTTEPIDVEEAVREALENEPSLRQRRITLKTRQLDLRVARNQLLPTVNLIGNLSLSGLGGDRIIRTGGFGGGATEIQQGGFDDALQQLFSGDFRNWSVGLSVTLPLQNWSAKASHAQASIREQQTLAQIAQEEQQIRVTVIKAARQLEQGAESVASAQKARELAERQLDAEERKFAVGTSTNFQVLQFQRQLADARTNELRSIINFNIARASFEQSKGTLIESLGFGIRYAGVGSARLRNR